MANGPPFQGTSWHGCVCRADETVFGQHPDKEAFHLAFLIGYKLPRYHTIPPAVYLFYLLLYNKRIHTQHRYTLHTIHYT